MGRKARYTVDYFPHIIHNGRSLRMLQQKYGNDGYAFLYKLLELLGTTEGHCLDLSQDYGRQDIALYTSIEWDQCNEMIELLAASNKIDKALWDANSMVWCQDFIDNVMSVYKRRKVDLPVKPATHVDGNPIDANNNGKDVDGSTHSRVEYSKGKESIVQESISPLKLFDSFKNYEAVKIAEAKYTGSDFIIQCENYCSWHIEKASDDIGPGRLAAGLTRWLNNAKPKQEKDASNHY